MTKLVAALSLLALSTAIGFGAILLSKETKEFPWLPFATDSQGEQRWLSGEIPRPANPVGYTLFTNYADCKARVAKFLAVDSRYKAPFGCIYDGGPDLLVGHNYYYMFFVNWLYDGNIFAGCIEKFADYADYQPQLIDEIETGPAAYCVGGWTDLTVLRSRALDRQITNCHQGNTGSDDVSPYDMQSHLDSFNKRCAELGIKTDCKLVRRQTPIPQHETIREEQERYWKDVYPVAECHNPQ